MAEAPAKRAKTERVFLFSSESVNEGHPDKLCDQVSDAVLDTCLTGDPKSKVACETATKDNMVMVAGEITTQTKIDYDKVVRGVVAKIGFDSYVDDLSSVTRAHGATCLTSCGSRGYALMSSIRHPQTMRHVVGGACTQQVLTSTILFLVK